MGDAVIAILVAVVASLPGVLAVVMQVRKNRGDAAESVSAAAQSLIDPLRIRVNELEAQGAEKAARLDVLTAFVEYLENGIHILIGQLSTQGYRATWKPLALAEFRMQRVERHGHRDDDRTDG